MDFKVAGTREGITGLQMDIKVPNVTTTIMKEALEQARRGRLHILDKMDEALPAAEDRDLASTRRASTPCTFRPIRSATSLDRAAR